MPHSLLTSVLCAVFSQPVFPLRTSRVKVNCHVREQLEEVEWVQRETWTLCSHETLLPEEPSAVTRYAWASALVFLRKCECVTFQLSNVEVVLNSCIVSGRWLWCMYYGVFVEAFWRLSPSADVTHLSGSSVRSCFMLLSNGVEWPSHSIPSPEWCHTSEGPDLCELRISTLLSNCSSATEICQCVCVYVVVFPGVQL